MQGYDREEPEDYDDYEDGGDEQEAEEEVEYEEEEERKPTGEELKYLELREMLKEPIRKKMQRDSGSANSISLEKKRKLPSDNYGSFFGPSQPVIAHRVIQESKSLLENKHLVDRLSNLYHSNKKSSSASATVSKNGVHEQLPKMNNALNMKIQKLKDTRDYSFLLSDDAEPPAPAKEPAPRNVSAPKSEARSTQDLVKSKQPSSNGSKNIQGGREERNSVFQNGQMHSKMGSRLTDRRASHMTDRSTFASKPNFTSLDPRRQIGSNNGLGPGQPAGSKGLPSKAPIVSMEKKASSAGTKRVLPASQKPSSKLQSPVPKQYSEQKKGLQEPKPKIMSKQPPPSSKPQISKAAKHISPHKSLHDQRPKKKPVREFSDDEDEKALSMIRKMFHTDRWRDVSDDDIEEARWDQIVAEERRSAKIAREEDEEELRLIEEEERREQQRKLAKKRRV